MCHATTGLSPSPEVVRANPGPIFEQWVGLELWKRLQYFGEGRLYYQRIKDGAEIDFIVERGNQVIPFEVKWTENPDSQNARHLLTFLEEHPAKAKRGYIVHRCPRPMELHEKVVALPWSCL